MLLAIDVGNTEMKLGVFSPGAAEPQQSWRITTQAHRTADEHGVVFTELLNAANRSVRDVTAVAVASVVPKVEATLELACKRYFGCEPVFLKAHKQNLIRVVTDRPGEVGADLVAAAIGARELYGSPLIVISYGTATVFTAISSEGEYLGVAIAPGINISIDALVGRTAKLPQIALEKPERAIGRDTIAALQSGIVFGFVGQTEAMIARFRAEMRTDAKVIATGGLARVIAAHTPSIDQVNQQLSLIGLQRYHAALA